MSDLNLNPHAAASNGADKAVAVPALADLAALAESSGKGPSPRHARRRFSATRLAPTDDGFRPFRIY
jgi:hypothetical protein